MWCVCARASTCVCARQRACCDLSLLCVWHTCSDVVCAHTFIRGETLSAISVLQYGALAVALLLFIGNNSGALGKPKTLRTGSCAHEVAVPSPAKRIIKTIMKAPMPDDDHFHLSRDLK